MVQPHPDAGKQSLLDHALAYSRRGWSMLACRGKRAADPWKPFQTAPPDARTLGLMFAKGGVTGLAVVTGQVSGGLAVRDFDQAAAYYAWAAANADDAARLPTVRTARGFHVFGRLEEDAFADLGDGELRADCGHYVLLPPSRHPDGPVYAWVNPLPPDPAVLLSLLPLSLMGEREEKTQQPKQHIACVPEVHNCEIPLAALEAIEGTVPAGPGQRNRRLFELARRIKGIPGIATPATPATPATLRAIVVEWHRQALPSIRTKDFAESWSDFQVAWQRVKVPHGTAVGTAYAAACRDPLPPIDDNAELGVLAALCCNLGAGGRPFYLACRTVESLFSVPRMTAWRWLQALAFHGVIESVQVGTMKDRRASTWRWKGHGS